MTSRPECTDQVAVNRPAVVADVRAAFERYEAALVTGDVGGRVGILKAVRPEYQRP